MKELIITSKEKEELAVFLSGLRAAPERAFWYIGRVPSGDRQPIAEELRGYIESEETGIWLPMEVERMPCCGRIEVNKDNKYSLLYHCATVEHIREVLKSMPEDQLKLEHQWMLDNLYTALTGDWK